MLSRLVKSFFSFLNHLAVIEMQLIKEHFNKCKYLVSLERNKELVDIVMVIQMCHWLDWSLLLQVNELCNLFLFSVTILGLHAEKSIR